MSLVAERSATKDRKGIVPASAIRINRFQLHLARRPRSTAVISRIMYKIAVGDGGPGDHGGVVAQILQRQSHADQNDKQRPNHPRHDPIPDPCVAHGLKPMSAQLAVPM